MRKIKLNFLPKLSAVVAIAMAFSLSPIDAATSPANAAGAQLGDSCATGAACAIGDIGPGGGRIVYINQDNPVVAAGTFSDKLYVQTNLVNNLKVDEVFTVSGETPEPFSIQLKVVQIFDAYKVIAELVNPSDNASLLVNGRIAKSPGWDYLQLAPKGWSGSDVDPSGTMPTNISDVNLGNTNLLTGNLVGTGKSNTSALLASTITDSATDAASLARSYGSDWFLPSATEMELAGRVVAPTAELAVEEGFGPYYETSTIGNAGISCAATNSLLYYTEFLAANVYETCSAFAVRPMRQLSNRVLLDPNYSDKAPIELRVSQPNDEVVLPGLIRYGYRFDGWLSAKLDGYTVAFAQDETDPTIDMGTTLYANWTQVSEYTVTFDGNGSSSGSVGNLKHTINGSDITLPSGTPLVRKGFSFQGWSETKDGTALTGLYHPMANTKLFAVWQPITCTVQFSSAGSESGTAPVNLHSIDGAQITLSTDTPLIRVGYEISSWSRTLNGSAITALYCETEGQTIQVYPIWVLGEYSITFDGNQNTGGEAPAAKTYNTGGTPFTLPPRGNLVRSGYTFGGWSDTLQTYAVGASRTVTKDTQYKAVWIANSYEITFDIGTEATGVTPSKITYVSGTDAPTLPSATLFSRSGYQLLGWSVYQPNKYFAQELVPSEFMPTVKTKLYAVWVPATPSCATGGACSVGDIGPGGGKIFYLNRPNAITSVFANGGYGYVETERDPELNIGESTTLSGISDSRFNGKIVVTEIESATVIQFRFVDNSVVSPISGGVMLNNSGWDYLQLSPTDWAPSSIWAEASAGSTGPTYATGPNLIIDQYQIGSGWANTESLLNGTISDPSTDAVTQLKAVSNSWFLPSLREIERAGLVLASTTDDSKANGFDTWFATSSVASSDGVNTSMRGLYGSFDCPQINGRCESISQVYAYDSAFAFRPIRQVINRAILDVNHDAYPKTTLRTFTGLSEPITQVPVRDGFSFDGWFSEPVGGYFLNTGTDPLDLDTVSLGQTMYAHWRADAVSISFESSTLSGGTVPSTINWSPNDGAISLSQGTMTRNGYDFKGWSTQLGGALVSNTYRPNGSATLVAIWERQTFTVSFDANATVSGSAPADAVWLVGDSALTLTSGTMQRVGYNFAGWSETDGGAVVSNTYTPASTRTLFAKWTPKVYAITFSAAAKTSGTVPTGFNYTYGTGTANIPASNLARTGYRFMGWSLTAGGALLGETFTPEASSTLFAIWQAKSVRTNFILVSTLKRSKLSSTIALATAQGTPIVVKVSGRCSVISVKSGSRVVGKKIKAATKTGTCTVTITTAEDAVYASFKQVKKITVK